VNRFDWLLLVISAAKPKPMSPVQLQKSLFLLERNLDSKQLRTSSFYQFSPFDYGPFSPDIYSDAESLEHSGLVSIKRPPATRYKLYSITKAGSARAKEVQSGLKPEVTKFLGQAVKYTQSLSFDDLVSAIYKAYPEMKAKSVFRR